MATKSNYRPSDLAYYTTWWLTSKPSISSQMKTSSSQNCSKSYDQYVTIDEDINQDEFQSNCCIPMKIFRAKR